MNLNTEIRVLEYDRGTVFDFFFSNIYLPHSYFFICVYIKKIHLTSLSSQ